MTLYLLQCSVMQSDGDRFNRDVVLDSFNMASNDEDSILDHICISKKIIFGFLLWFCISIISKEIAYWHNSSIQSQFFEFLDILNMNYQSLSKIKIFMIKIIIRTFDFYFLAWSKILFSCLDDMLKLFNMTSPQKVFPSDCITL